MSAGFADEVELLHVLMRADPAARDALTPATCDLLLGLCSAVAAMAPGLGVTHPARAARDGAALLLELATPQVDAVLRAELAGAVEAMALRRASYRGFRR